MKLLTAEIKKKLPKLYTNENKKPEDVPVVVKFFFPISGWRWYVTEGEEQEGGDWMFFGLVRGTENELGYFTLSELESIKVSSLGIERDLYFGEHTLAEVQAEAL